DAQPQLIAEAIAAFNYNNSLPLSRGDIKFKACSTYSIIINGTMPIFYKIPITTNLVHNVGQGTYPSEPTIVSAYFPDLPSPHHRYTKGMKPLDNRQAVLCCYEAFKHIIGI
ncbi:hypothetical protein BJY52DRAFT_1133321, partial [Lactarius psammicola]